MMNAELCAALAQAVAGCRVKAGEYMHDAQVCTEWNEKLRELEEILQCARQGMEATALQAEMQRRITQLREDIEREDVCPTFDWYDEHHDEHHYYKLFRGRLEACCEASAILQQWTEPDGAPR